MPDLKMKLSKPRDLSSDELKILNKMLSVEFEDKDIIINQLNTAKVISYCSCGCRTIDIQVDNNLPGYDYKIRVQIELKTLSKNGIPIIASIHIVNGYICELEVYRADSKQIDEDINLDNSIIEIYKY
jgi:hypothetical protein